jgi:hypothetical protein
MCFAPQADLVGGAIIVGIGVDCVRHVDGRADHRLLAAVPVLLGAHQIVEAFVWWGAEGLVPHGVGRLALWVYLLIAFVVLPIVAPVAVMLLEPPRRRRLMIPFVVLGTAVAAVLFGAMVRFPIEVTTEPYHLAYHLDLAHGGLVIACYVVAVCGALVFSGYRNIQLFGVVNLAAVAFIAWLTVDGFASVWCAYAALTAGLIALHLRSRQDRYSPSRVAAS